MTTDDPKREPQTVEVDLEGVRAGLEEANRELAELSRRTERVSQLCEALATCLDALTEQNREMRSARVDARIDPANRFYIRNIDRRAC